MNLTDREKEMLKGLIDRREPLPPKYRLSLFADAPEVELIWQGKTSEVTNVVLPFQSIEQIDEPRAEAAGRAIKEDPAAYQLGMEMLLDPVSGRQTGGWTNKLIWGDNKLVLSSLKNGPLRREIEAAGGLKLIYIDPPFDVGADFGFNIEVGEGESITKEASVIEELAYRDTWGRGTDSYLGMMYERLMLMRDLLAEDGSIFVHLGPRISHLVRLCADEVFGSRNYQNEVIWIRSDPHNDARGQFGNVTDRILWYGKSDDPFYDAEIERESLSTSAEKEYSLLELPDGCVVNYSGNEHREGRRFKLNDATWKGSRNRFEWRGARPSPKREWMYDLEGMEQALARGELYLRDPNKGAARCSKSYLDENKGIYLQDVWDGVGRMKGGSDYPTQKPERLAQRVINVASREGDLVADFFCGSGTTVVAAERLGRKWIGGDLGRFAIHTSRKRLIGVQRQLKAEGKPYRAFEILNLGKYERQYFVGIDPTLPEEERIAQAVLREEQYLSLILAAYKAERVYQMPHVSGRKGNTLVVVGPIDAPVTLADVNEIVETCVKRRWPKVDVLGFEFEMGLHPYIQDEARAKGVMLALKHIPKDVFDKRAIERGQVQFYDVAYVEAEPRVSGLTATVALTDFGVFYGQDEGDELAAALKPGGSRVTVENGHVVKIQKDKQGAVTRQVLTKHWTDWIDYWAVDFEFESKPEVVCVLDADGIERQVRTGNYIFENEWQSFRTKRDRSLELTSAPHTYPAPGRYKIAVKVIDIFGNDTTKVVPVEVRG